MRLRAKFFALYAFIFCSVLTVVVFSLYTVRRLELVRDTVDSGASLLEDSRRVRALTKDVMIGAFAPGTYADLKDVVYFEQYAAGLREWKESVADFERRFSAFMNDALLKNLVKRGVLGDEYETAWIMSGKAFASLSSLIGLVDKLRDRQLLGTENLYTLIQSSSDPELIGLFGEARRTSWYLANSFESYLNYFIDSLDRESVRLRRDLIAYFIVVGCVAAAFATAVTLLFSSRIVRRLKTVGESIRRVSSGDFSTPLDFRTGDEFQQLSADFNRYTDALKGNVSAMVSLARDVAAAAWTMERADLGGASIVDGVLTAIVEAAVRDTGARGGAFVVRGPAGIEIRVSRGDATFAANRERGFPAALAALSDGAAPCVVSDGRAGPGGILAGPLGSVDRRYGVLALSGPGPSFNDLDLIRFANYLEFAALIADNAAQYAELVERRNAEYQALQAQVRPHFLYNVLSGFASLNRSGDLDALERSILALKDLLRYTVDHGAEASVGEELAFCSRYCELQGMRFQDRLAWQVECDEAVRPFLIPKLLLQPLVENAIIHGIEPSGERGTLGVRARATVDGEGRRTVCLVVEDDGLGFDAEAVSRGVGLSNVERRLGIAFPSAGMKVRSAPGSGTSVEILIPEGAPCVS